MRKIIYIWLLVLLLLLVGMVCVIHTFRKDNKENAKPQNFETIRVLIYTADYQDILHNILKISSDGEFEICYYDKEGNYIEKRQEQGQTVEIKDTFFQSCFGDLSQSKCMLKFFIKPLEENKSLMLSNVSRSQGIPSYEGTIECIYDVDLQGFYVINDVSLETYLKSVVTSEMPSSYPLEALKAQAVCARTYACFQKIHPKYKEIGADIDDSVNCQVYNNIAPVAATENAVQDTWGVVLWDKGEIPSVQYFSTSIGYEDVNLKHKSLQYNENFQEYIETTCKDDYEYEEKYYRWRYCVENFSNEQLCDTVNALCSLGKGVCLFLDDRGEYSESEYCEPGRIQKMEVRTRNEMGCAEELLITGSKETVLIKGEYYIRKVLAQSQGILQLQDGSINQSISMLPSAYFSFIPGKNSQGEMTGFTLLGGGYGHGKGMSQNGAKMRAMKGQRYTDILKDYFPDYKNMKIY